MPTQLAAEALPFDQRLALLVQREMDWRDGKRVARLLKAARLKVSSSRGRSARLWRRIEPRALN